MVVPDIKRAFRGVDTAIVDDHIENLQSRIAALQASIAERGRTIARLTEDIADPAATAPSYAELGSTFEETLRRAEERARVLRSTARDEIATLTNKTEIELSNLRDKTAREVDEIIAVATTAANDLRLSVERELAQTRQEMDDERTRIETLAARAERSASSMVAQTEQQISDLRAANYREIAELERRAADVVRTASDAKIASETRFGIEIAEAQAESTALHDDADAYARDTHEAAEAYVASTIARAAELKHDADTMLLQAQARAREILQDSRALVQKSITDAMSRSAEIARSTDEFFEDFIYDAEISIGEIRRNKIALGEYGLTIRSISNEINVDAIEAGPVQGLRRVETAEIVEDDK